MVQFALIEEMLEPLEIIEQQLLLQERLEIIEGLLLQQKLHLQERTEIAEVQLLQRELHLLERIEIVDQLLLLALKEVRQVEQEHNLLLLVVQDQAVLTQVLLARSKEVHRAEQEHKADHNQRLVVAHAQLERNLQDLITRAVLTQIQAEVVQLLLQVVAVVQADLTQRQAEVVHTLLLAAAVADQVALTLLLVEVAEDQVEAAEVVVAVDNKNQRRHLN